MLKMNRLLIESEMYPKNKNKNKNNYLKGFIWFIGKKIKLYKNLTSCEIKIQIFSS